jgi:endonuclease/exonuclease/phosphatase family metal-dependent hydrolase
MVEPASLPRATADHPITPIISNRPGKPIGKTIKVVSFNAKSGDQEEGIIECLRRPPLIHEDVILLCEADWNYRRSNWRKFPAEVAEALNLSFVYLGEFGAPGPDGELNSFKGNAILCSQPLESPYAIPIPNRYIHRRLRRMVGGPAGLMVLTHFRGKALSLGVVHLNSRWDPAGRELQMDEYLSRAAREGPAVIGGDFNTTTLGLAHRRDFLHAYVRLLLQPRRLSDPRRWEPLFRSLERAGFHTDGFNAPGKRTFMYSRTVPPLVRPNLDWIAVRGLQPVPRSVKTVPARTSFFSGRLSDHDFIVCEVKL